MQPNNEFDPSGEPWEADIYQDQMQLVDVESFFSGDSVREAPKPAPVESLPKMMERHGELFDEMRMIDREAAERDEPVGGPKGAIPEAVAEEVVFPGNDTEAAISQAMQEYERESKAYRATLADMFARLARAQAEDRAQLEELMRHTERTRG